ncbi:MAG: sigma-54-dependent Fis family transcriptional regulator [Syntrophobacteraceae bacterium]|nr:sigma-54-dependent Fis family transcriptional regulator [Syntrophobacteraceae bacterium]
MAVLIVEPDPQEIHAISSCIRTCGVAAVSTTTTGSAMRMVEKDPYEVILVNLNGQPSRVLALLEATRALPEPPYVIVMSRKADLDDAVEMMKAGAHDFWVKPFSADRLSKTLRWISEKRYQKVASDPSGPLPIITRNPLMSQLKSMARRVAPSRATVFLQGESGTGKELFARYIHHHSDRRDRPFVAINCAALPESLMESELFGHEKGAFTGAVKAKEGKFELAHTGTLFLDEVTEIPLHLQSKLLRVLQENEIDRVGGRHPVRVDVRIIASTNRIIEEALREGHFRRDLYYRLNVIPVKIPPLRERKEDVPDLVAYFMERYRVIHKCPVREISPGALALLQKHSWPGNIRELENVVQRAMLLSVGDCLDSSSIFFDQATPSETADIELMPISEMEKLLIRKALASSSGNRTRAAEILGISVRTLRNKLSEYRAVEEGIDRETE